MHAKLWCVFIVWSLCGDCNKFPNHKMSVTQYCFVERFKVLEVWRGQARCENWCWEIVVTALCNLFYISNLIFYNILSSFDTHEQFSDQTFLLQLVCVFLFLSMFKTTVYNLCVSRMNRTYRLLPYCCSWEKKDTKHFWFTVYQVN